MPDDERVPLCINIAKEEFKGYPDEVHQAFGKYYGLTTSKMGALEPVYRNPFKYLFQAYHPFYEPGRLLNIKDFPIAFSYGDRDYMGSDGAEIVVKSNAFFKTGQSQIFLLPNSGHSGHLHNPELLVSLIVGFFNDEVRNCF